MTNKKMELSTSVSKFLFETLQKRFNDNINRHPLIEWDDVHEALMGNPKKLIPLYLMEETGGEPDVVSLEEQQDVYYFIDCSKETPKGRRKVCYDNKALEARKKFPPENSALNMATEMGISLLTEEQYRKLQKLESVDLKTSSWVLTPVEIRSLGGAIFCDRRYNMVFTYHNGADSYYGARGFRGIIEL